MVGKIHAARIDLLALSDMSNSQSASLIIRIAAEPPFGCGPD